jgi:branched-chain amino acid transport system permease protein
VTPYVAALFAGIGAGAVYGLLALGVVTTFRGSGVVNFSHGAVAAWTAYVFWDLRTNASYPLPFPGPVDGFSFGSDVRMTLVSAVVLALLTAGLLNAAIYVLIFRALRSSPSLARVVAGVGVLLYVQAMISVRFEAASVRLSPVLPNGVIKVTSRVLLATDALWLVAILAALAALLWLLSRYTRIGLAIRAASESEKGASLLGFAPDQLGLWCWIVAGLLAGIVGVIAAPLFELTPLLFTELLIPALGAALIARFSSFGIAALAGLGIGMVQALVSPLQRDLSWIPRHGARDGLVFVTIAIAMAVVGKRLPTRGSLEAGRLAAARSRPTSPWAAFICVAAVLVAFATLPSTWGSALLTSVIFTGLALSLVVLTGFTGQISLAQAAIAGIAGFSLSRLTIRFDVPFPVAPVLAALVAALFGVLVGVPALRVRGVNLAVVTLAGGIAVQEFVFKNPDFVGDVSTGGAKVASPKLFGLDLSLQNATDVYRPHFGLFVTGVVALLALAVSNLHRSATGQRMLAVRSNENAAAAVGINAAATKLLSFGLSSFIAGVAGTLVAYRFGSISDASFNLFASLTLLAFAYLGGITSVGGAAIAGLLAADGIAFKVMNAGWSRAGVDFGRWELVVGAVGLIVTAVRYPEGIAGVGGRLRSRLGRQLVARDAAGPR